MDKIMLHICLAYYAYECALLTNGMFKFWHTLAALIWVLNVVVDIVELFIKD